MNNKYELFFIVANNIKKQIEKCDEFKPNSTEEFMYNEQRKLVLDDIFHAIMDSLSFIQDRDQK